VKRRILLVDDHDLMREGLRAILEKEPDLEVVGEAASGHEAVRQAAELAPDVVIMDVAMKDLNGVEATRQIKAQDAKVNVVALSSYSDRRYVTAILRAGACAYVLKANAYRELRRAIQAALVGKGFLSEELAGIVVDAVRSSGASEASAYEILGAREREVLQLLGEGWTSPQIGARLHIATSTVETHRRNIMRKLNLRSVADLTRYAIREGIVSVED
jgi:DNA-binding NarL/FixJ family response regulator